MAQLYDKAAESVHDKLVEDVGDWIDPYTIASMIVGAIEEEWGSVTLDQCKDFWYRALEYHLHTEFEHIARRLPDPADEA